MDLLSLICFLRLHHSTQERGLLLSTADVPSLQTGSLGNSSVIHVWRSGIWCRFCGRKPRSWQGFLLALQKNALPRPLHCWRWLQSSTPGFHCFKGSKCTVLPTCLIPGYFKSYPGNSGLPLTAGPTPAAFLAFIINSLCHKEHTHTF